MVQWTFGENYVNGISNWRLSDALFCKYKNITVSAKCQLIFLFRHWPVVVKYHGLGMLDSETKTLPCEIRTFDLP